MICLPGYVTGRLRKNAKHAHKSGAMQYEAKG